MKYDEKLIEKVARAICTARSGDLDPDADPYGEGPTWRAFRDEAIAALRAIDASGTHWVAPWEAPTALTAALDAWADDWSMTDLQIWDKTRNAYLAERRKGEE